MTTITQKPNPFTQTPKKEGVSTAVKTDVLFGFPGEFDLDSTPRPNYSGPVETVNVSPKQEGPILGTISFTREITDNSRSGDLGAYGFILNAQSIEISQASAVSPDSQPSAEPEVRVDTPEDTRILTAQDVVIEKTDLFNKESLTTATTIVSGVTGKVLEGAESLITPGKAALSELIWEDIVGTGDLKPLGAPGGKDEPQTKEQVLSKAMKEKVRSNWNNELEGGLRQAEANKQMQEQIHDGTAGMSTEQVTQEAGYNNSSNEANVNTKANRVAIVLKRAAQAAQQLAVKARNTIKATFRMKPGMVNTNDNLSGESSGGGKTAQRQTG